METPELLTDDQDIRDTKLSMYVGGNGDYYIELKETKRGEVIRLDTRISMSGGNATPEVRSAVSKLFKALLGEKADTGENNALLPDVSKMLPDLLGLDNPYPLKEVVGRLKWATEYLLNKKSYDGHNYEELEQCVRRADEILKILEGNFC